MRFFDKLFGKPFSFLEHSLDDFQEVSAQQRVDIFKEIVTPEFEKIGLNKWDGKYTWFNDFNNENVKHVVHYQVLKGIQGSFSYGNCFSFIPTVSNGKKLINHRTDKSTILHLFERLDGWKGSFENNKNSKDFVLHWNEKEFRNSLESIIKTYPIKMRKWFEDNSTVNQNIQSATKQVLQKGSYEYHGPDQKYILAFLYANKGDISTAVKLIDEHYSPWIKQESFIIEKELVIKRLKN